MTSKSASSQRAAQRGDQPILIVDDDREVRDALREMLHRGGFQVETARSASQALDKLRWGLRPCVILADHLTAVMHGSDFRTEQRKDPALASIPVIAMTASDGTERELGAYTGHVTKPIDEKGLLDTLAKYC
jgi:CheY-like chemotaxis protein